MQKRMIVQEMFLEKLERQPNVFPAGRGIYIDGGPTAVLVVHGWTGWPGRLRSVASALGAAGFTVHVPRLPGHGTQITDMRRTGARDWLRRALDAYLDLRAAHETVYVVGTSMGGIIATILAAHYEVPRIALLAPALLTRNPFVPLAPVLQWVVPRIKGDWKAENEINPLAVEIGRAYAGYTYLSTVAQFYKMQRWGRKALRKLSSETLVIVSEKDGSVPARVVDYIEATAHPRRFLPIVLKESNHQLADHVEKETVSQAVVEWFTSAK
ncbi:MAG: alpha/beta hydrolase [Spirochaetales bacterium]